MLIYISIFLSAVSIILMAVILIRFKKLFSTESIIEKTQDKMNKVIMDINNNANRDIDLINEKCREARTLLANADRKMNEFHQATQLLRNMIAEAESTAGKKRKVYYEQERSNPSQKVLLSSQQKKSDNLNKISPEDAFSLSNKSYDGQRSLFDDDFLASQENFLNDQTTVTSDGAAYKEVPLISAKLYSDKKIEENNHDILKQKVAKLFAQGLTSEEIALKLSCSVSEVEFIIDMQ